MNTSVLRVLTHASTFFAPILVPIIVLVIAGDRETKNIAVQALIFHMVMGALIAVSMFLSVFLIGIPFAILFGLISLYYPIKGIIYAVNDRHFDYPLLGSMFR
ncbi:DUF4870 domain-containing protein [Brevibacillus dissolubilis]|uniref:DUF4870 domain-containing protein n=1 Tax=Brevibacillus dissolubilis TaxID=1844116 RepID=UPI001115CB4D|nr:DUF4870 domain-containing protein [Brevibacillus dissolubilis]